MHNCVVGRKLDQAEEMRRKELNGVTSLVRFNTPRLQATSQSVEYLELTPLFLAIHGKSLLVAR